jgi:hypothetical protein
MTTQTDNRDQLTSMAIAFGGIWASVLAISLFSPDLVSGSEQQHLPIAALVTWLWGTAATFVASTFWIGFRQSPSRRQFHRAFSLGVAGVWLVAALVSVFGPVMVTGTDPTRLPLCALITPIVATVVTAAIRAASGLASYALTEEGTGRDSHQAVPRTA